MPYTVRFSPGGERQFRRLSRSVQVLLQPKIDDLANDPRPPGVKKLSAEEELYRIRVGNYRVIYAIQDDILLVTVVKVGDRKEVYRRGVR
jgi:mRNA interferase RelE/StbE